MGIAIDKENNEVTLHYWKTDEKVTLSLEAWEHIIEVYEATKNIKPTEIKDPLPMWSPCSGKDCNHPSHNNENDCLIDEGNKDPSDAIDARDNYEREFTRGDKVRYIGIGCKEQINWGSHTDPRKILKENIIYTIDDIEVRSWHTKIFLEGVSNKHFNILWFKKIEEKYFKGD